MDYQGADGVQDAFSIVRVHDPITISLLIIGIIPWLAPLIKSFELPGGLKVEFSEDAKGLTLNNLSNFSLF